MQQSIIQAAAKWLTVACGEVKLKEKKKGHEGLAEALDWTKIWMLPNTYESNGQMNDYDGTFGDGKVS